MITYVPGELGKVLGSLLFAVGLFLVCTFYLYLYTGKIGLIYEGKQEKYYYISLPIMLVANAIGAFALGYLCFAIFRNNTTIMEVVNNTCSIRTSLNNFDSYLSTIIKSILCGLCVYIAVKCFSLNRLKPIGISLLVLFIFIFVYCGFQHCIANMFYFGFGNHINGNMFINLALVIVANSIGPIVGVGMSKLFEKKTA
jgi:formate/nitrite transporter FocA (FNT family)